MRDEGLNVQASILDRLIDTEPEVSHEPVQYRMLGLPQIRASVVRDLEKLLNTKRQADLLPPAYAGLEDSVMTYGLREFTAQNPQSPSVRQQLRQDIERAIARFEPRLRKVGVIIDPPAKGERSLRFRITAVLVVEPLAEPVSFDTVFDINSGQYRISP